MCVLVIRIIVDPDQDLAGQYHHYHYHYCLHFSMCACHPCAGAMLILSVSFQCPRRESKFSRQ